MTRTTRRDPGASRPGSLDSSRRPCGFLYALRAEEMPGAFERSIDTERFQRALRLSAKPSDVQATAEVGWLIGGAA
jgi:hypothetical protein